MNERKRVEDWLYAATSGIRFKPDREEVAGELREHLRDKVEDLQRRYAIDRREAEEMAVGRMGDPWQIGQELARIHKPWLGYLWRATQILIPVLLVMVLAGSSVWGIPVVDTVRQIQRVADENRDGAQQAYMLFEDPEQERRVALYHPQASTRLGDCTISVHRAVRWQWGDGQDLILELELEFDRPWLTGDNPIRLMTVRDDLGNQYMDEPYYMTMGEQKGLTWLRKYLVLEDFPAQASRVTFQYEVGPELELTVDLTQEVGR